MNLVSHLIAPEGEMETMDDMPKISAIITLYNKSNYIERALDRVLGQTFREFEAVVVNDGSTDGGEEKVAAIDDPRIRLINQTNAGVSAARNRGVKEARSDLAAFLDADDLWKPDYLEKIWRLHEDFPEARVLATSFEIVSGERISLLKFGAPDERLLFLPDYIEHCVKIGPPFFTSSVVVSRDLLESIGGFPPGRSHGEDLDTWFRLIEKSPVAYCSSPLAQYWAGVADSLCSTPDIYEEKPLLIELSERIEKEGRGSKENASLIDYVAWRRSMAIESLILTGNGSKARGLIKASRGSKSFQKRFLLAYLKSFLPHPVVPLFRKFKSRLGGLVKEKI